MKTFARLATAAYWLALTRALLVTNPWREFGAYRIAKEPDPSDPVSSFLLHSNAYAILALLLVASTRASTRRTRLYWLAGAVAHGAICEALQGFVPYRWPNVWDAVANGVGVTVVWGGAEIWARWRRRSPPRNASADETKKAA